MVGVGVPVAVAVAVAVLWLSLAAAGTTTGIGPRPDSRPSDPPATSETPTGFVTCVYKYRRDFDYEEDADPQPAFEQVGDVRTVRCSPGAKYCYAFWTDDEDGRPNLLSQGCWEQSDGRNACEDPECRADGRTSRTDRKFCCCKSSLCNASPPSILSSPNAAVSIADVSSASPASVKNPIMSFESIVTIIGASSAGLVLLIYFFIKFVTRTKKMTVEAGETVNNVETGGPGFSCSATCVDNLKLHDNIGSGRHAKVWRGSLGGIPVAVKALPGSQTALWAHERDVYCMPHMRHSNLLQYFGCDTRPTLEGPPEHLLVLQLAPLGSLKNFLTENILDWDVYTNMSLGIASALAHLHTHVDKDGQYKPCIVHRDVNSSNIVVRADLSCCLVDLGLAMPLPDSKSQNVQTQYRIQEAGTLRYLAPEALEGSLDLRRCAASLRAVDVYALSLVLWELLSRCNVLHRAPGPPAYAPPYQTEVGDQPTLERMQVIVARCKARPLFSPRLLPIRPTRLARDTCEDCWDHDAEARLTAVCVVERLSELKNMRPASSPTINSNDLRPSTQDGSSWHSPGSCEDKNSNLNSSLACNGNSSNLIDFQANMLHKLPLQPHQGRNPCLERNLATVGSCDHLIDKSLKDMPSNSSSSPPANSHGSNDFIRTEQIAVEQNFRSVPQDFSRPEEQITNSSMFGIFRSSNRQNSNQNSFPHQTNHNDFAAGISNTDDQLLNELRPLARPITPIGYVQNDVSSDVNGIITTNGDANPYGYPAKRSNILQEISQPRWGTKQLKKLFDSKLFKKKNNQNNPVPLETEVNFVLSNGKPINNGHLNINCGKYKTSLIVNDTKSKINRDNFVLRCESSTDRPSSLPGLDSVGSDITTTTECSLDECIPTRSIINGENSHPIHIAQFENNTCMISPPNRTVSQDMVVKIDDCGSENLISGYRELHNIKNIDEHRTEPNPNTSSQIFSVIVPKSYICNDDINSQSKRSFLTTQTKLNRNKIEDKLLKADNCESEKYNLNPQSSSKRYSCDGKIGTSFYNDSNDYYKNNISLNSNELMNRNSYSGEIDAGESLCKYENDYGDASGDYSSNSEDEHMLLLSENGGSKITMRQRYDVKSSHDKNINRKSQATSSPSLQEGSNAISKIAAESFSNLCNKYGNKNKYENFQNELGVNKIIPVAQSTSLPKEAMFVNHRNRLSLSICKQNLANNECVNINENIDNDDSEKLRKQSENSSDKFVTEKTDNTSSDDDETFPDEVFTQKSSSLFKPLSIKQNLSRQHSLELVSELFSSTADFSRLKDPANRIKTPGDVPPSVRKMRGSLGSTKIRRSGSAKENSKSSSNRLSLYDDRMMFGNSL